MRKKKRGGNKNGASTFEQLSFFDLLEIDVEEPVTETVTRYEQSAIFDVGNEQEIRADVEPVGTGNEFTLQSSLEGTDNKDASGETSIYGKDDTGQEATGYGKGRNDELADEFADHGQKPLPRIYLSVEDDRQISLQEKIEKNIKAVEMLNQLDYEVRQATEDEQQILAEFSGWGGCPQLFNEKDHTYEVERSKLKDMLSLEEYQVAKSSTLTSFYTPLEIIENMYHILSRLGFEYGKILETSLGTGNFIGMMSDEMFKKSAVFGIELDTLSASIASQLYPNIDVENIGFEKSPYPDNQFDLAISNVPFGNYQVYDRKYEKYHFKIHNYFFAKALDQVRDGGLVAFITSSETMDGNSHIMEYINERADFLGAIRLPSNVFTKNGANTEVVSDILFLRRNDQKEMDWNASILKKVQVTEHREVNQYFIDNPNMVFGTISEATNQFGGYRLVVLPDEISIQEHFQNVFDTFDLVYQEQEKNIRSEIYYEIDGEHSKYPSDTFFVENDTLYYRSDNVYYKVQTKEEVRGKELKQDHLSLKNKAEIEKVKQMILIADCAVRVINIQSKEVDEQVYLSEREKLNNLYDTFVKQFGALHKRTNLPLISDDPKSYLLDSLEDYDVKTQTIKKSQIFFERTVRIKREVKKVDNIYDGLLLSLDNKGGIDVDYIATLYGEDRETTVEELLDNQYVFSDPETKDLVLADDYLSGNIRKKLRIAKEYGETRNIEALEKVMPEKIEAQDIVAQLGATWIPEKYVREFMINLFELRGWFADRTEVAYDKALGMWVLDTCYPSGIVESVWGVAKSDSVRYPKRQPDYTGYDLFENVLNSKIPTIRNYWEEWNEEKGRNVSRSEVNIERTTAAQELVDRLNEEWEDWIFSDLERREELVEIYNEMFNSTRLPNYDGSYLTFPEMNTAIQLENYQKNAIARIMNKNANTLLWQKVGAGKTYEMVAAGMEMKRLGIRNKILYVVPNHLIMQWHKEFLTLYPNANLLVATKKDFAKAKRQAFVNKIATGNYDAIIMAHSSFGMISLSKETQLQFEQEEYNQITSAIELLDMENSSAATKRIKILERTKKSIKKRIEALTDSVRDHSLIPFENLGIDFLFVDESHEFKNLYTYTAMQNVAGLQTASSQKAQDMYMKCRVIERNGGGICFATGTPVTNTMAELYTLQRFLQSDELEYMGCYCFDAWAKAFGKVVTNFEISIDGTQFVNKTRFSKFFNVQELMTIFRQVAEIQTEKMLREELEHSQTGRKMALPPKHVGGKPQVISIEPSKDLEAYIADIVKRSEKIHNGSVDSRIDNMLKVTSDSKKASIDMRLIDPTYPDDETRKLWVIARKIYEIYQKFTAEKATQLVFCDSSTPHNKQIPMKLVDGVYVEDQDAFHNVYDELKKKMIALGIPENEIAFIHDYNTELKKLNLFQKMNDGEVRVLIGSTPKLGAGTNVQKRLIAVHHVDVPWKASDIEQQNGRAFRQGNSFNEIYEFRYVTKKSFDAYSWQMVETKSTYMEQLLAGADGMREFEEDQRSSFSYAEVKAIASGNPIVKEKFEVDNEVRRLENLKKNYRKKKLTAQEMTRRIPAKIKRTEIHLATLEKEWAYFKPRLYPVNELERNFQFVDWKGRTRRDITALWKEINEYVKPITYSDTKYIGEYLGAAISIKRGQQTAFEFVVQTPEKREFNVNVHSLNGRTSFENLLKGLWEIEQEIWLSKNNLEQFQKDLISYQKFTELQFPQENELRKARVRQKEINEILDAEKQDVMEEQPKEESNDLELNQIDLDKE